MTHETKNELPAVTCDVCGWCTKVWVEAAPGSSEWACKVCDLRAEINVINTSREKLAERVEELQAPPRGIGGQIITVMDSYRTYGELLHGYYVLEEQMMDIAVKLARTEQELERFKNGN